MTNTKRVIQVSSELFWGFRVVVDIVHFDSVNAIIQYVQDDLRLHLQSRNLQALVEKLKNTNFHIHSPHSSYENLLKQTTEHSVIYICDHCEKFDDA